MWGGEKRGRGLKKQQRKRVRVCSAAHALNRTHVCQVWLNAASHETDISIDRVSETVREVKGPVVA